MIIFVRNGERDKLFDGLSKQGTQQVLKRAKEIKTQIQDYCNQTNQELSDINLVICSSPFEKCLQTADLIKDQIESKQLKFKKKYDKIFTQYELGDYQHPNLCSKEDIDIDSAKSYIKSLTKESFIDPQLLPQNNYKKETNGQVEERIGAFIYQITNKLQNSKDSEKQVYIVVTHKFVLEILVDIFEGSREISESGLITIKFSSDQTFGISFYGKVFPQRDDHNIDDKQQFQSFPKKLEHKNYQEDEEEQEDQEYL